MKIILGVFWAYSFDKLKEDFACTHYQTWWEEFDPDIDFVLMKTVVMKKVYWAALEAEEIYFDLSHIRTKINRRSFVISYTINELFTILTNPDFFEKTRFFKHGEELDKNKVFNDFIFNSFWKTI